MRPENEKTKRKEPSSDRDMLREHEYEPQSSSDYGSYDYRDSYDAA